MSVDLPVCRIKAIHGCTSEGDHWVPESTEPQCFGRSELQHVEVKNNGSLPHSLGAYLLDSSRMYLLKSCRL